MPTNRWGIQGDELATVAARMRGKGLDLKACFGLDTVKPLISSSNTGSIIYLMRWARHSVSVAVGAQWRFISSVENAYGASRCCGSGLCSQPRWLPTMAKTSSHDLGDRIVAPMSRAWVYARQKEDFRSVLLNSRWNVISLTVDFGLGHHRLAVVDSDSWARLIDVDAAMVALSSSTASSARLLFDCLPFLDKCGNVYARATPSIV